MHHAYQKGQLLVAQRRGIELIPKKKQDHLLKTGAQLPYLNATIGLPPNLVNSDQTGFMKGQFIGDNITGGPYKRCVWLYVRNIKKCIGILRSLDIVNE